jgi:aminopeptidase N
MPGANFDYERAARALAIAAINGDATATQAENISGRTLQRYRKLLETDDDLARLVHEKKTVLEREWAHEVAPTLRAALAFIQRAANGMNHRDPEALHAMAGALKLVNEAGLAMRVIDARLAAIGGSPDQPAGQVPAGATNSARAVN